MKRADPLTLAKAQVECYREELAAERAEVESLRQQLAQARKWIETWGHNGECLVTEGHPDYACDCEVRHILPALACHPESPEAPKESKP